jgi:YHS domain-containing protein
VLIGAISVVTGLCNRAAESSEKDSVTGAQAAGETCFPVEDTPMKNSPFAPLFAITLLATTAACGGATESSDAMSGDAMAGNAMAAEAAPALYADLGGENSGPVYTQSKGDTLAVRGYDVVSYFTGGGVPVEGSQEYTVRYEGYDYRFASKDNADAFVAEPAKYAPAYGGYCAWAIGENDALAPGDPNVYKIVDDKLYLNFSEDVATKWNADIPGFIASADVNYPTHAPDEHFQD